MDGNESSVLALGQGRSGKRGALGRHVIVDLYGADRLEDIDHIEAVLRRCVDLCKAALLGLHVHRFPEVAGVEGVTGVAVLQESHISIHTWPEHGFAAMDIFVCGGLSPLSAVRHAESAFCAERVCVRELGRGDATDDRWGR